MDTELASFKRSNFEQLPTLAPANAQMRCLRCGKFYTVAEAGPCFYHSGTWVEPMSTRDGALCGWSCCRIEGRIGPKNLVTLINPNAMIKHSKGCKQAQYHTEDKHYSQIVSHFPLQEMTEVETAASLEKGKEKEVNEEIEQERARNELPISKDGQFYVHEVESGDTLVGVSLKYGVSKQDIRRVNKMMDDNIITRKTIMIPRSENAPTPEVERRTDRRASIREFKKKVNQQCADEEVEFYLAEADNNIDIAVEKYKEDVGWEKNRSSIRSSSSTLPSAPNAYEQEKSTPEQRLTDYVY